MVLAHPWQYRGGITVRVSRQKKFEGVAVWQILYWAVWIRLDEVAYHFWTNLFNYCIAIQQQKKLLLFPFKRILFGNEV